MSYLIVLDTNIIFNDFYFKSADMKKLLKFTKHRPVELCITAFNYHEIIKKFKDKIRPLIKTIKSTKNALTRLGAAEIINFKNLKADIFVEKYKDTFDDLIKEHNIKIIDFPKSSNVTETISLKYFNNKKPFDENKESFQDAIIWESIVEYCRDNEPNQIVFISNNHKDFANSEKNAIHGDLVGNIGNVTYFDSLSAFLEKEADNLKEYITTYTGYDFEILEADLKEFSARNGYLEDAMADILMSNFFEGQYILDGVATDGYIEDFDINIEEASLDIEDQAVLIDFKIEMDVSFYIEDIHPRYGYDDDAMFESSRTKMWIRSNATYLLKNNALIDYVEIERGLVV
ncbi:PIN domain-containing protein [Bacillus bingmayongensis]|uniref:PIN domain-containing protein n=1 Tax=Bacillus bingmayongensis TaxID=1150157 RepID=UPI001C8F158E|nr:PIN domain-containing protein [Bacillus bingmayongensis]MBY0600000.1 PIN domain-containing protein [Bacillus bingmayongensis]